MKNFNISGVIKILALFLGLTVLAICDMPTRYYPVYGINCEE